MAPSRTTEDYYFILEVGQSADMDCIKSSYKRLARLRHPDKNRNESTATAEFQLVSRDNV
jgi:DnaJ-class molecular chaperone